MKANWIVVFLAAFVVAIAVVKVVTSSKSAKVEPAAKSPAATTSEASFKYKSSDMPVGTFDGMTDAQKYAVMKVMNDNMCDCGCDKG